MIASRCRPFLLILLALWGAATLEPLLAQRPQTQLPRVHFVATGGTISNRDGGRLSAEELAKSMPGVERFARLTHEQFTNVASSELTLAQWVGLAAERINKRSCLISSSWM